MLVGLTHAGWDWSWILLLRSTCLWFASCPCDPGVFGYLHGIAELGHSWVECCLCWMYPIWAHLPWDHHPFGFIVVS